VLVVEPGDATRWIELRADVAVDGRDPIQHLDAVAMAYTGRRPYFGEVVPAELAQVEHPVVYRLAPVAVVTGPMYVHGGQRRPDGAALPTGAQSDCTGEAAIPASHRDLLGAPTVAALSTRLPTGRAQTQPVWCVLDGNDVLVNTTRQRRKGRNLAADPRATVIAIDAHDTSRWIEIRGDVSLEERDAPAVLDRLTRQYTGHGHYYGTIYPVEQQHHENRVTARIHPRRITCDAVHR
jgi:PPOX class probable F420-dependent enzyme